MGATAEDSLCLYTSIYLLLVYFYATFMLTLIYKYLLRNTATGAPPFSTLLIPASGLVCCENRWNLGMGVKPVIDRVSAVPKDV